MGFLPHALERVKAAFFPRRAECHAHGQVPTAFRSALSGESSPAGPWLTQCPRVVHVTGSLPLQHVALARVTRSLVCPYVLVAEERRHGRPRMGSLW